MSRSRKPASCALAFANGKGGVGKTSLIANLSVRAARDAHVALLDYDGQQSLARWCELRGIAYGSQLNPRLWKNGEGAPVDVQALKQAGSDWILQDVPPATWHLIEDSVRVSDLVIVPVKASPVDLEAVDPIIEVCSDLNKPFVFVLAQYDARWKLSESAFPYLEAKAPGHTLAEVFSYRQAYVGSMIGGATGPEYTKDRRQAADAGAEIDALWLAIRRHALGVVGNQDKGRRTMNANENAPRIKPIDHGDLRALLEQAPRQTSGTTVRSRRSRERAPVKSTDGRRRRSTNRNKQFNTNVTEEVFEIVTDMCERHDLTKAEFAERAFLQFIETLRGEKENGVARG